MPGPAQAQKQISTVLKSKSSDARIQAIADLYKIGYCTEPVEERIANAEQEPTYLMALK